MTAEEVQAVWNVLYFIYINSHIFMETVVIRMCHNVTLCTHRMSSELLDSVHTTVSYNITFTNTKYKFYITHTMHILTVNTSTNKCTE
jgi:hypothetical protein